VRDPLPDHPGWNIHPAKLPAARRTTQQVAAENVAKKQAIKEKIHELERAKEILAQMNISEELEDEEPVHDNPQCLSAAVRKQNKMFLDDNDGMGEEFNFDAVDADTYSDDLSVNPVNVKVSIFVLRCTLLYTD